MFNDLPFVENARRVYRRDVREVRVGEFSQCTRSVLHVAMK
jgi:hypothetical protein